MNTQEALAQHFAAFYQVTAANTAGMTHEQSLIQPLPGGNCANWILGHLVRTHNSVMKLLGEAPVWDSDQLTRAGFDPITGATNAIDWDTLRDRLLGSKDRCLAAAMSQSDAALAESIPNPFGGTATRAEMLHLLAFHQAYHAGQLAISRRAAGLEGVIKGPGQREAEAARTR